MTDRDGGPAFPSATWIGERGATEGGLSIRDYFAAHAPPMPEWWFDLERGIDKRRAARDDRYQMRGAGELMAAWAHLYADSMLAARKETNDAND